MKFSVEQWQTEYGAPTEDLDSPDAACPVDFEVERKSESWSPIPADPTAAVDHLLFVDGVRRIEARVWIQQEGAPSLGLCASCGAGVARCDGKAALDQALVRRFLIAKSPPAPIRTKDAVYQPQTAVDDRPDSLMNALAQALSSLEVEAAEAAGEAPLIVIDGPLRGRERIPKAVGYVKSHRVAYLNRDLALVVPALAPGERTPVFLIGKPWSRYSWYLRLPGGTGHPWAGVVRCEAPANLDAPTAIAVASATAATLPAYASEPHRDPRAPQNLYPIKGLEDALRARLGHPDLLYRSIRLAAQPDA